MREGHGWEGVVEGLCGAQVQASCGLYSLSWSVVVCGMVLVDMAEHRRGSSTYWAPGAVSLYLNVDMLAEACGVCDMHPWIWKCQWSC